MNDLTVRDIARLGLIGSTGVILFVLESLAPRPLPWMKLGLGNLPVLVALLLYGPLAALAVSAVKMLLGGLLSGGLGGPAFVIGATAGLSSLGVMAAVWRCSRTLFSPVGLSVLGAVTHQLVQLFIAHFYVGHIGLFALLPLFLISGLASGSIIGILALWSSEKLNRNEKKKVFMLSD